jgi:hypothetical protein
MGATGLDRSPDSSGNSAVSDAQGNSSGNTRAPDRPADALAAWIDACPVTLSPDGRVAVLAAVRTAGSAKPADTP